MHSRATTRRSPRGARTAGSARGGGSSLSTPPAGSATTRDVLARGRRARGRARPAPGQREDRAAVHPRRLRHTVLPHRRRRRRAGAGRRRGAGRRPRCGLVARPVDDDRRRGRGGRHRARRAARRLHPQHTARSRRAPCRRRTRRDRAGRLVRVRVLGARGAPRTCGSRRGHVVARAAVARALRPFLGPGRRAREAGAGRSARRRATTSTTSPTSTSRTGPPPSPRTPCGTTTPSPAPASRTPNCSPRPTRRAAALDFFGRARSVLASLPGV